MNILFYTPFVLRSRDTESVMIKLKEMGHNVSYLSLEHGPAIEEILIKNKIPVFHSPRRRSNPLFNLIREVVFLIKFCRKNKIHVAFCHLEPCNLPSVLAQYFINTKIVICRHHVDDVHLNKKSNLLIYRIPYFLGRKFIVVSRKAKDFMVASEKIDAHKIEIINLAYNFDLFDKPDLDNVIKIRNEYKADMLLLVAARLVKNKRIELAIELVEKLKNQGINVKLIILGDGELMEQLRKTIAERELLDVCFLPGWKNNVIDYLSACDIMLNPSISESSSVIVKEAGLCKKTVIVCKGVGDCEEYIKTDYNGILTDKDNFVSEAFDYIVRINAGQLSKDEMGANLHNAVHELFNIDTNIKMYNKFLT